MMHKKAIALRHNFLEDINDEENPLEAVISLSNYFNVLRRGHREFERNENLEFIDIKFQGNTVHDISGITDLPTVIFMHMSDITFTNRVSMNVSADIFANSNIFYTNGERIFSFNNIEELKDYSVLWILTQFDIIQNSYTMNDCITNLKLLN